MWDWTDECQRAFDALRNALTTSPVLAVADPNKPYILHTDASDIAMGAILQQLDDQGDRHPIAYASKTFNGAQSRYDTTEREALAIVWALEHFNTYCEGHKYTLLTDHQALSYIRANKDNTKRITRWQLLLQHYHLDIFYLKGKDNHAADLLSRNSMEMSSVELALNTVTTRRRKSTAATSSSKKKKSTANSDRSNHEVQLIVDSRPSQKKKGDTEYRIRWKGYVESDDTWESSANVVGAKQLIAEFEQRQAAKLAAEKAKNDEYELLSRPDFKCDKCDQFFANESARHLHHFHTHQIQLPTDLMRKIEVTTDPVTFAQLQRQEPQFRCIFNSDLGQTSIRCDKHEARTLRSREFIVGQNGILYTIDDTSARSRMRTHTELRVCVPKTERQRILHEFHDKASHPGVIHLYDMLQIKFWWPGLLKDVYKYVQKCTQCQVNKNEKDKTLPRPMTVPTRPWSHIAIDHIGPFPQSNNGNTYILVIVDRFTRYAEGVPVTDTSATSSAEVIIKHIVCRYGMFDVMLSDRGSGFLSEVFTGLMRMLGAEQKKTTAHHPQSNGLVERFNKTLKKMLKRWVNQQHSDWDVLLPFALFAYNTSMHSTVKQTPYYLNFARQARTITDVITRDDFEQVKSVHAYAQEVVERLRAVHEQVRGILVDINIKRQNALDDVDMSEQFTVGDLVWLHDPTTPVSRSRKFIKRWRGPYMLLRANNNGTSVILKDDGESLVSNNRLRRMATSTDEEQQEQQRRDIELATEEVELITDRMNELTVRRAQLQTVIDVAAAANTLDGHARPSSPVSTSTTSDDEEVKHDDESDDDEQEEQVQMHTVRVSDEVSQSVVLSL